MTYQTVKLDFSQIGQQDFKNRELTLYKILWDGVTYDLLVNYVPGSDRMVAFGTGTKSNRALPPPFFARPSWYPDIPVTAVWYGDPTFYDGDLPLYWYYGSNDRWHLPGIAFLLFVLADMLEIDLSDSVFFGSSGGGYSSMVLAALLHGKAVVINPQFLLANYNEQYYSRFLQDRMREGETPKEERIDLVRLFLRERYVPHIDCLQNIQDTKDVENQISPFLAKLSHTQCDCGEAVRMEFYYDPNGHNGMPSRERTLQAISQGLDEEPRGRELFPTGSTFPYPTYLERIGSVRPDQMAEAAQLVFREYPESSVSRVFFERSGEFLRCSLDVAGGGDDYLYAYYLLNEKNRIVDKISYAPETICLFSVPEPGTYRVKCFVRSGTAIWEQYSPWLEV